jgi:phosphoadenosine phosphosulfate reductase
MRGLTMATVIQPNLEERTAEEVLEYMVERFHPRLYVACSFQKEASVILDMLVKIEPEARFFVLDTGVLFKQTYETWKTIEERYGIEIDVYKGMSLERQAELHGDELWNRDPDACCGIRKVGPMEQALSHVDAWVAGLRRDQSPTRAEPAGRLERERRVGLHSAPRRALQRAPRPRLRLDRLHALHVAGRGPRRALGGHRQDRVRPARLI